MIFFPEKNKTSRIYTTKIIFPIKFLFLNIKVKKLWDFFNKKTSWAMRFTKQYQDLGEAILAIGNNILPMIRSRQLFDSYHK
jgi:hypothetical protein